MSEELKELISKKELKNIGKYKQIIKYAYACEKIGQGYRPYWPWVKEEDVKFLVELGILFPVESTYRGYVTYNLTEKGKEIAKKLNEEIESKFSE